MFKKVVRILLVSIVALSLAACTAKEEAGGTYNLKVWGSQDDQALLAELVEDFKAANPKDTYNIELGVVGEPDALDQVTGDLEASADVFAFANDQIRDFVAAGALYEITLNKDAITAANMEGAIDAVTLDGKMYGIPFTADNGYFLYYDSNFFTEDDVKSMDTMVAKAMEGDKKVFMDVENGWYIASFFLGAGGNLGLDGDKQVVDFNSDRGVLVGEYIANFVQSKGVLTGKDEVMDSAAADGIVKAAVSGAWKADDFKAAFGDGYAATKLPEITLDGKGVQMGSFAGYKVYGVNAETSHPEQAMALAEFLSNEASQVKRFKARSLGPSNLVAAESTEVQEDIALSALAAQGVYAHSQKDVTGAYWGPAEAFGVELVNGNTSNIKALLDEMVNQITQ